MQQLREVKSGAGRDHDRSETTTRTFALTAAAARSIELPKLADTSCAIIASDWRMWLLASNSATLFLASATHSGSFSRVVS